MHTKSRATARFVLAMFVNYRTTMRRTLLPWLMATLVISSAPSAYAHPHIFVDAQVGVNFDSSGRLARVHNRWTFDEAYSAWAVQNLDEDRNGVLSRDELQPIADDNIAGLAQAGFYTFAGEGRGTLEFTNGWNQVAAYSDGRLTLEFDAAPERPYAIRSSLELAVNDPQYYVAITFKDANAVQLVGAPTNCSAALHRGREMPPDLAAQLYALPPDVTKLPADLAVAVRDVQGSVQIGCPGGSAQLGPQDVANEDAPATALEAVNELAAAAPKLQAPAPPSDTARWWWAIGLFRVMLIVLGGGLYLRSRH